MIKWKKGTTWEEWRGTAALDEHNRPYAVQLRRTFIGDDLVRINEGWRRNGKPYENYSQVLLMIHRDGRWQMSMNGRTVLPDNFAGQLITLRREALDYMEAQAHDA